MSHFLSKRVQCVPHSGIRKIFDIAATMPDAHEFCDRLLEVEQVAVIPASAFGPSGAGFVRASYTSAHENLEEALIRIDRLVKHYR